MTETWTDGNSIGGALRDVFSVDITAAIGRCQMRQHRPARRGPHLQPLPGTGPALPRLREPFLRLACVQCGTRFTQCPERS